MKKINMMIDKYDNYIKKLFESYENPVDIRWIDKDNKLIGLFIIDNIVYKIECSLHDNDMFKVINNVNLCLN